MAPAAAIGGRRRSHALSPSELTPGTPGMFTRQMALLLRAPRPVRRSYLLRGDRLGTEYEMLQEQIRDWDARRQYAEDRLEELRARLAFAEGRPD